MALITVQLAGTSLPVFCDGEVMMSKLRDYHLLE